MAWHPNDLVTDTDLVAYERTILTQFDQADWQARRQKALEDWLFPLLEERGFDPEKLRTRHTPASAVGLTSSVATNKTTAAGTADGLNLTTILAASSDALYIGFPQPFRGLSCRMLSGVNAVTNVLSVHLWADTWQAATGVHDGTRLEAASFGQGGAITWQLPEGLVKRAVTPIDTELYWARLKLSVAPTSGTLVGPVQVIRRSRLCAAVTFRTLCLIYREAPVSQEGPWEQKAQWYETQADRAWLRVQEKLGGEFDTDGDDAISSTEAGQTTADVAGVGWTLERL